MLWPQVPMIAAVVLVCGASASAQYLAGSSAHSGAAQQETASVERNNQAYCQSLLPDSGIRTEALKSACLFSLSLGQQMPNFVCDMSVEKYEDVSESYRSTQHMQRISARARYVNGKDFYDDLRINGKPSKNTNALIEGTWSFGEFGAKLLAAFTPKNHPSIHFSRGTTVNGVDAFEYSFSVPHNKNQFWRWLWGKESAHPGYEGKIWIGREKKRILRLELNSTDGVPEDFPNQSVESRTDYSFVDFKDHSGFVLPSKVQVRTRMLHHRLYRTQIVYSKCHRFRVDSRIVSPE